MALTFRVQTVQWLPGRFDELIQLARRSGLPLEALLQHQQELA
jgi:hypothetical protein